MYKKTIVFFIFFMFSLCCFAQQSEMVFLNNVIEQNKVEKNEEVLKQAFYEA